VTFGYQAGNAVVQHVSFTVGAGETVALVGKSGSGKSTLGSLILRLFDPWSGRVLFNGQDIRAFRLASFRSHVALVLQEPFLLPLTIADNIAYGRPSASREEVMAAARAAQADAFIRQMPDGYDTVIGERGATLSGGQRQRISIARAFLKNAPVLILDEPTASLDAQTESELMVAMERLLQGRTAMIIAHRPSTVRYASRVFVLEGGRITESGRPDEPARRGGTDSHLQRVLP
jgi:ATP-binding cassette subfamily B protein/subfamily B ATP-binding cassette protein MsbA